MKYLDHTIVSHRNNDYSTIETKKVTMAQNNDTVCTTFRQFTSESVYVFLANTIQITKRLYGYNELLSLLSG